MLIIPIKDVPAQNFSVILAGQQCQINLYTRGNHLYCDLSVNNSLIVGGVSCVNMSKLVINSYLGFVGDLIFFDSQGNNDPSSPGLGSRYKFIYLAVSDLRGAK